MSITRLLWGEYKKGKKLKVLLLSLLMTLGACSSLQKKSPSSEKSQWIDSAIKFCEPKGFLCALGSGKSLFQGDLKAKSALAAIFETEISSELSSEKTLSSKGQGLKDFDLKERINKRVTEKVSQLLTGVEILERTQWQGEFYSLGGIDRLKASKRLRDNMAIHDDRLEYLWKKKKKTSLNKMLEHYYQREAYNQKLSVLAMGIKSPVSLSQLDSLRDESLSHNSKVLLELGSLDDKVSEKIRAYMAGLGYRLVLAGSPYDYKVKGVMKKSKEYFKVKGFSRVAFSFSLRSFNPKGVEVGGLNIQKKGVGRTEEDAFSQIEPEISTYIINHLDELRLGE